MTPEEKQRKAENLVRRFYKQVTESRKGLRTSNESGTREILDHIEMLAIELARELARLRDA